MGEQVNENAQAAEVCEHYFAWVSSAGAKRSARICMLCHQPDAKWLNHIVEVNFGHPNCIDCEFAEITTPPTSGGAQ